MLEFLTVEISTDGGGAWSPCEIFARQSHAVAGVGVLALRLGESAKWQSMKFRCARYGRKREATDVGAFERVAGRGDGIPHGIGGCDVKFFFSSVGFSLHVFEFKCMQAGSLRY